MIINREGIAIDMWGKRRFVPRKFRVHASFYPHGSFGYSYRGNIYNEEGNAIGDYATNDSAIIDKYFLISWGK